MPPPTNQKPGYEDDAQYLDISQLILEANADGEDIVFCGTDYGLHTQSITVQMTLKRFDTHIKLYNRFEGLENQEPSSSPGNSELKEIIKLAAPTEEKCLRLTSGEIQQISLAHTHERKRGRRKVCV